MKALGALLLAVYCGLACAGGKGTTGAKGGPVMGAAPVSTQTSGGGGHGGGAVAIGAAALAGTTTVIDPRRPPPMDPERKVVEKDCTKPVDFTTGNLKCK